MEDNIVQQRKKICEGYVSLGDKDEAERCFSNLIRDLKIEQSRLTTLDAVNAASRQYVEKHGISRPDIDAKLIVAIRKRQLFALILTECRKRSRLDLDALNTCLDQLTKAEVMLGNDLRAPAPQGWPNTP